MLVGRHCAVKVPDARFARFRCERRRSEHLLGEQLGLLDDQIRRLLLDPRNFAIKHNKGKLFHPEHQVQVRIHSPDPTP
jgi:hypothetical protein